MNRSAWKIASLAALLALGVFALMPGGPTQPTLVSADHDEVITIVVDTNPETNGGETFEFSVTGSCTSSPALEDDESTDVDCALGDALISSTAETGFVLQAQSCSVSDDGDTAGNNSEFSDTSTGDNDIRITLADNEHITCTFTFDTGATATATVTATSTTPTATVTGTAGPAASLTVSAAPSTVNCGGSSFVTVVVKNAQGGNVADGTSVSVTTNSGTVSPGNATTSGGGILTIFTAPSTGGTAKITATSGSATGSADITVNCGPAATATTAAPPPVPTVSTGGGGVITPPSTGDAGLTESDGGIAWRSIAAGLLIVSSLVGGLVLARRRA
jgi:hypothetical protein